MRLRFSIRDCLLVTAIVGLALGWWVDRQRLIREHQSTREALLAMREKLDNPPWDTIGEASLNAIHWKRMALEFAEDMRKEGWFVSVSADGWGSELSPPHAFADNPGRALELNKANPLPIP